MKHDVVTVRTTKDQIKLFCEFAEQFKSDFELPELKKFLNMPFPKVCAFLRSKYRLEEGEQILRPIYFYRIGSDCDDATIFVVALLRAAGIPKDQIYIVEAKETADDDEYVHIFCALQDPETKKLIWFDNLPGTDFNKLAYRQNCVRFSPMTDYV